LFCLPNTIYDLPAFDLLLEWVIIVVGQSPAQAMSTATA
jgi:hypothetical protein